MKNKKGFTLIELLAIIVILAIIAVITVPLILNIINDAKQNASIDSAYGYKSALEKYYMKKVVENTENELPNGYKNISELPEDFIVSGESPSDGWVKLKKGIVDRFSLKYDEYVVTMDNDKNVTSEKQESIEPHVTNDYQEVAYLESTGTQYINSGIIPTVAKSTKIKMDVTTTNNTEQDINAFGTNNNLNIYNQAGKSIWRVCGMNTGVQLDNQKMFHIIMQQTPDGRFYSINGETGYGSSSEDSRPFYISGINGTPGGFKGKTGTVVIYENDTIARNYVPAIRKSDNKPGMLDLSDLSKNLFDSSTLVNNTHLNLTTGIPCEYNNRTGSMTAIDVSNLNNVTLTYNMSKSGNFMYSLFKDGVLLSRTTGNVSGKTIDVSEADELYLAWYGSGTITTNDLTEIMLNEGTTALPYEPYGYKFYTNNGTGEFIAGPEI